MSSCNLFLVLTGRILSYLESSYKAPEGIHDLEQHGKRGDRILVRGISTGSARVTVKPQDSAYKVGSLCSSRGFRSQCRVSV